MHFPATIIATIVSVLAAADTALTASGTDLANTAIPAAILGPLVTGEAQTVVASFAAATVLGGANPIAIVGMAAALPPTDPTTSYGRYGAGSATTALPIGTTVASLQAQLANQRAAVALAATGAGAAAASYSASTDMPDALAALVEAMRAGITDPADQVNVLLALAGFTFTDQAGGTVGIGAAMAAMRDAMAAACRRAALVSLARASAAYQPVSYNDAASLRRVLSAALDSEITLAGDAGQDASYVALKALRSAVVQDLTVRGASLPSVVTVSMALPLPALLLAQILYQDASRSDQITAESGAIHPAFCPATFQALAAGTGPTVNPSYVLAPDASTPLIAPAQSAGVYQLAAPNAPVGLTAGSPSGSTLALAWSAGTGGVPSGYIVQVSPTGAGIWTTAGTVGASPTSFTVTGLASSTFYDFQVLATNAAGTSVPSVITTANTLISAPNAPAGVTAAAGSPAYSVVGLSWTASVVDGTHAAAVTYTPQFALVSGGGWTTFGSAIAGTSVSITGLSHATAYKFQVIATNVGGTATSTSATSTTAAAAPNVPTGLAAGTLLAITTSSIALAWTAAAIDGTHDAATTYTLQYRVTSVGGAFTQVTGLTGTSGTVSGLAAATQYDFQIDAVNAGGSSAFTATSNGTTLVNAITVNSVSPSPFAHGSGPGVNVNITTPTAASARAAWGSSATVEPTSGWASGSNYSGTSWAWYLGGGASVSAGTAYLWVEAQNAVPATIGLLVTGPYTVT